MKYYFTLSSNTQADLDKQITDAANVINVSKIVPNLKQEITEEVAKQFDTVIGAHTHEIQKNALDISAFNTKLQDAINKVIKDFDSQFASLNIPNNNDITQSLESMRNNLLAEIHKVNARVDALPKPTSTDGIKTGLFLTYEKDSQTYTQMELKYYEAKEKKIVNNHETISTVRVILGNYPSATFIKEL